MAVGTATAIFALAGAQAVSQISQGYAQKAEAKYNATIFEGQAGMIEAQSEIDQGRYQRLKGQYMSKSVANVAKSGIGLQGSALAVMIDTQTQIGIDQAISKLNFDKDKNYALNQADAAKRAGKSAVRAGYTGALSSMLQGGSNYAQYKMPYSNTTFDSVSNQSPVQAFGGGVSRYYR